MTEDQTFNIPPMSDAEALEWYRAECHRLKHKIRELRGYRDDAMKWRAQSGDK